MPIGDLLAQIKGEQPQARPAAGSKSVNAPDNKRKAESGLNGDVSKVSKTAANDEGAASSTNRMDNGNGASGSAMTNRSSNAASKKQQAAAGARSSAKVSSSGGQPMSGKPRDSGLDRSRPTSMGLSSEKAPKKRSYAEIMQRATIGQQRIGPVGKIQHRSVTQMSSSGSTRAAVSSDMARRSLKSGVRKTWRSETRGGSGTAQATVHDDVRRGHGSRDASSAPMDPATSSRSVKGQDNGAMRKGRIPLASEPEKNVKKAVLATTGYRGTARPSSSSAGMSLTNGKLTDGKRRPPGKPDTMARYGAMFGARRSRRDEEEDEEMDDFIEYDDEEELPPGYPGGRGRYDESEDDESDMEAGFSDQEAEDHRASLIARREDQEQEVLERTLKREKEERKRMLLQGRRQT
jgi:protein SPT2